MEIEELYDQYRPLLFTLAYQLTGVSSDAEDMVQDVFVKLHQVEFKRLENPKAYLCKMITSQCIDYLQSARKKREQYVGTWLPEPAIIPDDVSNVIVNKESLSYSFLVLMEQLSPVERAIFLLREAYQFDYQTISTIIAKSEVNCRKIMSRARGKIGRNNPPKKESVQGWMDDVVGALQEGNVERVLKLLAEDVIVLSDGGGKVPAALYLVQTKERVYRFLTGLFNRLPQFGTDVRIETIKLNDETGIIVRNENMIFLVAMFEIEESTIQSIYFIRNPDKLLMLRNEMDLL